MQDTSGIDEASTQEFVSGAPASSGIESRDVPGEVGESADKRGGFSRFFSRKKSAVTSSKSSLTAASTGVSAAARADGPAAALDSASGESLTGAPITADTAGSSLTGSSVAVPGKMYVSPQAALVDNASRIQPLGTPPTASVGVTPGESMSSPGEMPSAGPSPIGGVSPFPPGKDLNYDYPQGVALEIPSGMEPSAAPPQLSDPGATSAASGTTPGGYSGGGPGAATGMQQSRAVPAAMGPGPASAGAPLDPQDIAALGGLVCIAYTT
jgi:hypothetical protein